jgi:hypothetical protein
MSDGFSEHVILFLSGSTALGIIAHAVNTFPTPENKYGQWFLGLVQFIVGQRIQGNRTLEGKTNRPVPDQKAVLRTTETVEQGDAPPIVKTKIEEKSIEAK